MRGCSYEEVDTNNLNRRSCGAGRDVAVVNSRKIVRLDCKRLTVACENARLLRLERLAVKNKNYR